MLHSSPQRPSQQPAQRSRSGSAPSGRYIQKASAGRVASPSSPRLPSQQPAPRNKPGFARSGRNVEKASSQAVHDRRPKSFGLIRNYDTSEAASERQKLLSFQPIFLNRDSNPRTAGTDETSSTRVESEERRQSFNLIRSSDASLADSQRRPQQPKRPTSSRVSKSGQASSKVQSSCRTVQKQCPKCLRLWLKLPYLAEALCPHCLVLLRWVQLSPPCERDSSAPPIQPFLAPSPLSPQPTSASAMEPQADLDTMTSVQRVQRHEPQESAGIGQWASHQLTKQCSGMSSRTSGQKFDDVNMDRSHQFIHAAKEEPFDQRVTHDGQSAVGDVVQLKNLVKAMHLNGKFAVLQFWDREIGQWEVELLESGESFLLHPNSMQRYTSAEVVQNGHSDQQTKAMVAHCTPVACGTHSPQVSTAFAIEPHRDYGTSVQRVQWHEPQESAGIGQWASHQLTKQCSGISLRTSGQKVDYMNRDPSHQLMDAMEEEPFDRRVNNDGQSVVGDVVQLKNLVRTAHLNGKCAVLRFWDRTIGHWEAELLESGESFLLHPNYMSRSVSAEVVQVGHSEQRTKRMNGHDAAGCKQVSETSRHWATSSSVRRPFKISGIAGTINWEEAGSARKAFQHNPVESTAQGVSWQKVDDRDKEPEAPDKDFWDQCMEAMSVRLDEDDDHDGEDPHFSFGEATKPKGFRSLSKDRSTW